MQAISFSRSDEPVHVVLGDSAAGLFHGCKGIVLHDNLVWGPSDADPARHAELRRAFWRDWILEVYQGMPPRYRRQCLASLGEDVFGAQELADALASYPSDRPVLLWTAALWLERLTFWWVLDAICKTGLDRRRFWVAQPQLTHWGQTSLACFGKQQLKEAFAARQPLRDGLLRSGAALWRKYAAPSGERL
jgi:hypothetical protein